MLHPRIFAHGAAAVHRGAPGSLSELSVFLALLLAQLAWLSCGGWMAAEACFAGVLLTLMIFVARRVAGRQSGTLPPTEFVWIPLALAHGLIGTVLS